MAGVRNRADELEDAGVRVVALSADGEDLACAMQRDEELAFAVLYGVDARDVERRFGIYTGDRNGRPFVQPAQFILDPDGVIRLASYSSGRTGRVSAEDALEEIESFRA